MKGYRDYMDRQQVSPALHDRLLTLEQQQKAQQKNQPRKRWQPVLAMAACLCLVLGVCWSWSTFSPAAHSAASTAEYAMDDAAVWEETDAAQEDADESIPETAAAASTAGGAAEPEAEESAPAQEAFVEDTIEDEAAKEALTLPEHQFTLGCVCLSMTCFELAPVRAVTFHCGEKNLTISRDEYLLMDDYIPDSGIQQGNPTKGGGTP